MRFSRRRLLLCSAALAIMGLPAMALPALAQNNDDCEPYANIDISVTPVFDEPVINATVPLAELQKISRTAADVIPHYDSVALGLTHYEPVIEFSAPIIQRELSDGTYCAKVQRIDAKIGYRNTTVFIGQELMADACASMHVLAHEKKHIAVNYVLLQEFVPLIQQRLSEYLKLYGMFRVQNPSYAEMLLRSKANAILSDMSQKILEENRRRQRLVDTPEEYARNNTVCGGRINTIIRNVQTH